MLPCSPVGDFIPASEIIDPHALELWYKINNETKQNASTELMLYKIDALIAHCSSIMRFEEGDLLLTGPPPSLSSPASNISSNCLPRKGTPAGVGQIKAGDSITAGLQQNGKDIALMRHVVIGRNGGYEFKA